MPRALTSEEHVLDDVEVVGERQVLIHGLDAEGGGIAGVSDVHGLTVPQDAPAVGRIDPGENELKAAKRELLEETGFTARKWKRILRFWASPGFVAEAMSIYLASELTAGMAEPEDDEVINIQFVPLKKAVAMVLGGRIQDAKTIAGVLWLDQQSRRTFRK